jgi:hypothetical protein
MIDILGAEISVVIFIFIFIFIHNIIQLYNVAVLPAFPFFKLKKQHFDKIKNIINESSRPAASQMKIMKKQWR